MAWEIMVGQPPFTGNPQQVLAGHLTRRPEALSAHRTTVPPALEAIVMRCLEKNAADRPQSADEILRALDAITTTSQASAPAPVVKPKPQKQWGRVLVGAAAALVLAAAGVAWFARVPRARCA